METIGRHKYNFLKSLKDQISEEDKNKVLEYEKRNGLSDEMRAKTDEYFKSIHSYQNEIIFDFSAPKLFKQFLEVYKTENGKDFIQNSESLENLKPILLYFARDEKFFNSKNLRTKFNFGGVEKISNPSFDKGILIIGGFGNGKTSIMKTFHKIFCYGLSKNPNFFSVHSTNEMVKLFESCENSSEKDAFFDRFTKGVKYFDDVKSEEMASNFGKKNVIKHILEERYLKGMKTYITCNYHNQFPEDLDSGIAEFAEIYGNRVFDRLFEMFNIVEFKGKSFRN